MQNINQLYKLFPPALSEVISTSAVERMNGRALTTKTWTISLFCLLEIWANSLTMLIFNYIVNEIQMFIELPDDKYTAWSRLALKSGGCLNHHLSALVLHPFPWGCSLKKDLAIRAEQKEKMTVSKEAYLILWQRVWVSLM